MRQRFCYPQQVQGKLSVGGNARQDRTETSALQSKTCNNALAQIKVLLPIRYSSHKFFHTPKEQRLAEKANPKAEGRSAQNVRGGHKGSHQHGRNQECTDDLGFSPIWRVWSW